MLHRLQAPGPGVHTSASAELKGFRSSVLHRKPCPRCPVTLGSEAATLPSKIDEDLVAPVTIHDLNQNIREGHYEASLVQQQARKKDSAQPLIASVLLPANEQSVVDVLVVGAGPAGLFLASELATRGLQVSVIGADVPFVNNYGVWVDEFEQLGLSHTLEAQWPDAVCYFGEGKQVKVGRGYGRVDRRKLRAHLLSLCEQRGVRFTAGDVTAINNHQDASTSLRCVEISDGRRFQSRMITLTAGAAGGRFLQFEEGAPVVASQSAYGIEAEVEGYGDAYPEDIMVFMDFRRHHTGVIDDMASRLLPGAHPNAGDGLWGSETEVPSFLYAMPLGGNRVFLEETCLVARPTLPFATLKRRLHRRLAALGIKVREVHEEEWSYIPVGGPLPLPTPDVSAFGAAANLVHPATGFSVSRTFREAPSMADQILAALNEQASTSTGSSAAVAVSTTPVWSTLWPDERRACAAFHVFGMELLATLDLESINAFFTTFFRLPSFYWRGFLSSSLSSGQLVVFAMLTFVLGPFSIKYKLVEHLVRDPAGRYLITSYKKLFSGPPEDNIASTATDS